MRLELAFLCDAATESGGKLNALGIAIDRLIVPVLPQRHRRLVLVVRIVFEPEDQGSHQFAIELIGPDGNAVAPRAEAQLEVQVADPAQPTRANVIIELANPEFTVIGPHEAKLSLDGSELVALPLEVSLREVG
ncbi:MAG: hypothetical protein O3A10_02460 [Chloroflexi bacterium]|nr:hypothetical protein [Chloroflexota bacterium]MDA1145233.1 hypothetical protein [Chloroflexota bacterium]